MNKLVAIVIRRLGKKELKRWQVTQVLRNYSKEEKLSAIEYMIENKLIEHRRDDDGKLGRTAIFIKLSKKGRALISEAEEVVGERSLWRI